MGDERLLHAVRATGSTHAVLSPRSLAENAVQVLEIGENLKVLMSEERMTVLTQEIDEWAAQKAKEDSMEVNVDAHTS